MFYCVYFFFFQISHARLAAPQITYLYVAVTVRRILTSAYYGNNGYVITSHAYLSRTTGNVLRVSLTPQVIYRIYSNKHPLVGDKCFVP